MFLFEHSRQVIKASFEFEHLEIPEPGEYRLKLFVVGEFLMERSLRVTEPCREAYAPKPDQAYRL